LYCDVPKYHTFTRVRIKVLFPIRDDPHPAALFEPTGLMRQGHRQQDLPRQQKNKNKEGLFTLSAVRIKVLFPRRDDPHPAVLFDPTGLMRQGNRQQDLPRQQKNKEGNQNGQRLRVGLKFLVCGQSRIKILLVETVGTNCVAVMSMKMMMWMAMMMTLRVAPVWRRMRRRDQRRRRRRCGENCCVTSDHPRPPAKCRTDSARGSCPGSPPRPPATLRGGMTQKIDIES
jgi:hypothetical protein